ncbi:hypothetical protein MBAV_004259 [Candidatus Magnetobacterium bavaricum]|uniref:Uncharacterized protein n=1 Tax=Candidatus Magnetobacterium bavaricum TaxID=29290 RepID=A0A0F3GP08_9BACT|nr:hypothetical protein MBAV_004259 [Candidatus Magnetobacterium bavaricum]
MLAFIHDVSFGSAFWAQANPVRLSVTVPSPLFVNLGLGHATPFFKSPSSPAA